MLKSKISSKTRCRSISSVALSGTCTKKLRS